MSKLVKMMKEGQRGMKKANVDEDSNEGKVF
jgi:hypothetical protein